MSVKWIDEMDFLGIDGNGRSVVISGSKDGHGVSPMHMVLLGLGGCAAIDVVEILHKQRQPLAALRVEVRGRKREGTPSPWAKADLHFVADGDLDPIKVERAVRLSAEKYCSVAATLSGSVEIAWTSEVRALQAASA